MHKVQLTFSGDTYEEAYAAVVDFVGNVGGALTKAVTPVKKDPEMVVPTNQDTPTSFEEYLKQNAEVTVTGSGFTPDVEADLNDYMNPTEPAQEQGVPIEPGDGVGDADRELAKELAEDERDSKGQPWDERIHAANKTKNKDGSWRKKRGVSKELVEEVESGTAEPAPVKVDTSEEYAHLMKLLSQAVQSGVMGMDHVTQLNNALGVSNVQEVNGNAEKIAEATMFIETLLQSAPKTEQE